MDSKLRQAEIVRKTRETAIELTFNIDGTGNRLAPIIWGPDKVIFVASAKKIAANVHAAIDRIKCDACPPNCIRLS